MSSDFLQLEESMQREKDTEWKIEELLIKHKLLEKVEKHENPVEADPICPLCEQPFETGDLAQFCKGKPIHPHCINQLEKKQG